ncbi:MAG: putative toxin-antitoxin system toxin component, PIN family [Elusimicrobia bacterium]|nr:putative toxin-antitoxin system toxin component, PIN family [Elusimicrobiota bacterium]
MELWAQDKITAYVSPEILEEYERLPTEMDRKKPVGLTDAWRRFIVKKSILISPEGAFRLCRDPDDDKLLQYAGSAGVQVLVSGDKDLLVLKKSVGGKRSVVRDIPPTVLSVREALFPLRRRYFFRRFPPGFCWVLNCILEKLPPTDGDIKVSARPKKMRRIGFRARERRRSQRLLSELAEP